MEVTTLVLTSAPDWPHAYHHSSVFEILWLSLELLLMQQRREATCICVPTKSGRYQVAWPKEDIVEIKMPFGCHVLLQGDWGGGPLAFDPLLSPGPFGLISDHEGLWDCGDWYVTLDPQKVSCPVHPALLWVWEVIACLHWKIGKDNRTDLLTYYVVSKAC